MQIAQIVPKVRTNNEGVFDYSIPPSLLPMIKIGLLVLVPFHGRKIEGIIIKLKSKSRISNLKSIINIIDPIPVVDENNIKVAIWMSDYYLAPLSKTLFEFIVPPAKRTIKILHNNYKFVSEIVRKESTYKSKNRNYLIISDFSNRLRFYLAAINKTVLKNQSVIVLVPDLSLVPYFTKYLKFSFAILHSNMTKTQRWLEWDKIRQNKVKIIIGSQSALFSPIKHLGLIIIDQEENQTFKNDQSPRFHAVKVAQKLSDINNSNLIIGSLAPRIETYYEAINSTVGKYKILNNINILSSDITIIDMNTENYIISNVLEKEIDISLLKKQKIILVLNRKGEGTKFTCHDCHWIALCDKCGLPLIPQKSENVCYHCNLTFKFPETCPKCNNINIKPAGLGTSRLKKFLNDLFPKANIIQIEKDKINPTLNANWDIVITTSYGLKFNYPNIGLVAIVDADLGFNFPDYSSSQNTFTNFYKFLRIGVKGIVQTHLPENPVIKSLAKLDYEKYFLNELNERKKYHYPPFTHLAKLIYKNIDENYAKKESERIYHELKETLCDVSFPYSPFIKKDKHKFRYQIVLKFKKSPDDKTKNILLNLPKGWIVDIDPTSLL